MSPLARTFAGSLFGVALYVSLIGVIASESVLTQNLTAIAQPLATLFAGVVGLGAIAYQAQVGFANLKAGQDHRADIERDARSAEIEHRTRVIVSALAGELEANAKALDRFVTNSEIDVELWNPVDNADQEFELEELRVSKEIFGKVIDDIGYVSAHNAARLIDLYSTLEGLFVPKSSRSIEYAVRMTRIRVKLARTYSNRARELAGELFREINEPFQGT